MEHQKGREKSPSTVSCSMERGERLHPDAEWDAGDMGCGELVLELRMRLQPMQTGQLFKLTARDPGAPEDLPAWCRLTGHRLVMAVHPVYWIGRRED
jgi:tRNA 2-thiouridine synthesizing protein A